MFARPAPANLQDSPRQGIEVFGGTLVATEFGATAVTSPSYGSLLPGLGAVLAEQNREVAFCDQDSKGYILMTLTPDAVTTQHVAVSTVLSRTFDRRVVATHRVASGARAPVATV